MNVAKSLAGWQLWLRDDPTVQKALLDNKPNEAELSDYGHNDAVLDYLIDSGLWTLLTGMEADGLKCRNGFRPEVLNGVEVIRELAGVGRIAQCGKVLSDTRLMLQAGFNLACVQQATVAERPVIDSGTLRNHLARISPVSAQATFAKHVRLLRQRRLMRGTIYAADAHEIIIPYGQRYERMGKVGSKRGFKLVILINVTEDRERIVGFGLAPLQTSERTMLGEILKHLNQEVAPLKEWLKILLLDRGYWGAQYLLGLHREYGIDVVTRAQHDGLEAVDWIEGALADATWQDAWEERSRLGKIQVRVAGVSNVPLYDGKDKLVGTVNAVVADEYDQTGKRLKGEDGQERPRFYYVTTMRLGKRVYSIRALYNQRWVVENQGFRELTQVWSIDTLAGKRFTANYARIAFVLMLYNAERIMRMKKPEVWAQERERVKQTIGQGLIGGRSVVVYTPDGRLGLFKVRQYREIIRCAERQRVVAILRRELKPGDHLQDILDKIEP